MGSGVKDDRSEVKDLGPTANDRTGDAGDLIMFLQH